MNLLKTSALNGVAVLIKTATMFILNKILAIYVGPAGYAAIGQFQNFIQMITMFAGNAINNGVVKYTAEYNNDINLQHNLWRTAGTLILLFSILLSVILIIFSGLISEYLFKTIEYKKVILFFSFFLIFFTFNSYFIAILNGKKEVVKIVICNILGSLISLIITILLSIKYGLYGALISLSIFQSLVFFVTLWICYKENWFKVSYLLGKIDKDILKKLSNFALMAFISVFFGNISQIILRNIVIEEYGIIYAGYWDAMNRLSLGYLMFASTILSIYYLPKLSELEGFKEIKKEVNNGYLYILPIAIITSVGVYIFKDLIVKLLFTENFLPMLELIAWQLIGDIFKIGSWIISFMMLSKAMTKIFSITEIIFSLSIIPLTLMSILFFGFKGISIAFALNCLIYWCVCSHFSFKKLEEY